MATTKRKAVTDKRKRQVSKASSKATTKSRTDKQGAGPTVNRRQRSQRKRQRATVAIDVSAVVDVLQAFRKGHLDQRVALPAEGTPAHELAAALNGLLAFASAEIERLRDEGSELALGMSEHFATLHQARQGDLSARAPESSPGELVVKVSAEINGLLSELEQITSRVGTEIVETAGRLDMAAVELLSVAQHQSQTNSSQAAALSQSASAVTQLSASAKEIAGTSRDVHSMAVDNLSLAGACRQSVRASADLVAQIGESMDEAAERMALLGEKSTAIGEVTDIIDGIANRTNLLALNAAIEAARAGEAGRGFSVVAVEIRKLAETVAKSTGEIKRLIREIQDSTAASGVATEQVTKQVRRNAELSSEVTASLEQMVEVVTSTSEHLRTIQEATGEQTTSTEEMAHTVQELTGMSQEAASAAKELFESAQELTALAHELKQHSESIQPQRHNKT